MEPRKTSALASILRPALDAALNASGEVKKARMNKTATTTTHISQLRNEYEALRDEALQHLHMTSIEKLFLAVDAAVGSGNVDTILLLRDQWRVELHPLVNKARDMDTDIRELESELEKLRNERNCLVSRAISAGLPIHRIGTSLGRKESTIKSWRSQALRS